MIYEFFTTIDLEMSQPSGRIIQIGAVVGSIKTGEIVDRLSVFINQNEILSEYIINLTGITQNDVNNGVSLQEGYDQLCVLHKKHNSFCNFLQWGCGDSETLREQLSLDGDSFIAGRRSLDVKTMFIAYQMARQVSFQGGLARSMTKLGLRFQGKKHNAASDAENTFKLFMELQRRMRGTLRD